MSLANAREKLEGWRRYYNEDRPHSAIGYNVPIASAQVLACFTEADTGRRNDRPEPANPFPKPLAQPDMIRN